MQLLALFKIIMMTILNSFIRGSKFIKFSAAFLLQNKDLLIFPFLSFIASIAFIGLCIVGGTLIYEWLSKMGQAGIIMGILLLVIAYFVLSFIILYFTTSLYVCTLLRLSGKHASLKKGMVESAKKWKNLIGWSLLSTTVGFILQALESLNETIADILSFFFGLSWAVASYFVLPILITENIGPIKAIKRGAMIFGKGWRKAISVNFVLSIFILSIWGLVALIIHFSSEVDFNLLTEKMTIGILSAVVVFTIIVGRVFNTIITSGLYLNLIKKESVLGLDQSLAETAFREKKEYR
ncbi:TPA: hypothetical protein JBI12_11180 [Legionella pneumophila]|nr:hypothetical protein [Legionella pneumophila]